MDELLVRQPKETQWQQTTEAIMRGFAEAGPDREASRDHLRPENRRLSLLSGDQVVGGCFSYAVTLSLPGGAQVPAAGLAGVGILPTEQGRGGLRLLIDAHLQNSIERGDAVSLLMASESGLYGRFGYSAATEMAEYRLDTRAFSLKNPTPRGGIELLVDEASARIACANIHAAQLGAGELQRSEHWWAQIINSGERSWLGGGAQFVAVHRDIKGNADAYALYVVKSPSTGDGCSDGNQHSKLILRELVALDASAEAAMFQYLCNIAWVRELQWVLAPVDPMIKHLMTDPRQLVQSSRCDMLWQRVLDMPRLLTERAYDVTAQVDFHYVDEKFPQFSGYFRLSTQTRVSDQRTRIDRIESLPSGGLTFGPEQLAAFLLGGTRVIRLYQLGEISGEQQVVRQLDRLFLVDRAPFNLSKF